jgi:cell division protein FtsZ
MSQEQSLARPLRVRIIGVGGAGCNAAEHIAQTELGSLPLALVHTHARVLQHHSSKNKVLVGLNRSHGLGTGGDADLARVMAEEAAADLTELVEETDLLFIVAGLGGGTGTGVAPVVARAGKQSGALVIAVVTTPFDFEGSRRLKQAQHGLQTIRSIADAVICLPNQKVCALLDGQATVIETFAHSNELLARGLRGICQMLTKPGLINVDFGYLHSVLRGRHTESALAAAEASGPERAREVIERILNHPLLEAGAALSEADQVLLSVAGPRDLTVAEITHISDQLRRHTQTEEVIIGTAVDDSLGDKISLTLIVSKGGKSPTPILSEDGALEVTRVSNPVTNPDFLEGSATPRPAPRFVAPPPDTTPEKTLQLLDKQKNGRLFKSASKWKQEMLALEIVSRGRFEKSEPTIHRGADLDVPTYIRRGVPLN